MLPNLGEGGCSFLEVFMESFSQIFGVLASASVFGALDSSLVSYELCIVELNRPFLL